MRLTDAAMATNKLIRDNHSILIYGPPKSGKTRLVATAAKNPSINRLFWFDGENGASTIRNMGLTESELAKFILYKIADTKENPYFIETMLKVVSSKTKLRICDAHGRATCPECSKIPNYAGEDFLLSECTHNDLVIIDSGSQLGNSAMNASVKGKPDLYKPQFDDYGNVRKWLSDILSVVQQAHHTNFIVITHELSADGEDGVERLYPLMGTKPFSTEVSKYFGTVVYTHFKLGKHAAASSSTFKPNIITGSRLNIRLENSPEPTMTDLLKEIL
jgi:hypothetical protein